MMSPKPARWPARYHPLLVAAALPGQSAPAVTEVPTPSLPEVPTPAAPGSGSLVQGLKASVDDRAKAFKETLAKLRAGRDEAGQRVQEEQDRVQATKTEAESVVERARNAAEKGRSEIASKAAQVKEAAQKIVPSLLSLAPAPAPAPTPQPPPVALPQRTHGFLPLFLAQFLMLAAYGGGVAALVLIPEKQWKTAKQTVGGYTEAVSPAVQGVLGRAQPLASKDFSTKAAPYAAKALESAQPIAFKAWAGAKPLLGKAAQSAGKLLQSAQSQARAALYSMSRGNFTQVGRESIFGTGDRVVVLRAGEEDGIGF
eukprot:SM000151S01506  [mRNA]  locus=s151:338319:341056:+ [translate_table: standard]